MMTHLKADFLLVLAAFVWGTAFVAQKTGMDGLGPISFVGLRFCISFLCILPFAIYEYKKKPFNFKENWLLLLLTSTTLLIGMYFQQNGMLTTSVTNAGFLTGLYVVFTPFIAVLYLKHPIRKRVWFASIGAFAGIWLLSGASFGALVIGDWSVIAAAFSFAFFIVFLGALMARTHAPLFVASMMYLFCAVIATPLGMGIEGITTTAIFDNIWPLLYVGVLAGAFAFTMQAIAQQHTPPAIAAVIFSAEALFAALAGVVLLGERMDLLGIAGCALIFAAMLLVEVTPID